MSYLDPKILARITPLGLRAQKVVEGSISGLHRSPLHGVSVEFADYREYTPGDDLKRIDWRAYARSNKFQIKRYEEESNLRCTLVLDASASMGYGNAKNDGSMTKFDYAATLAASMASLLVRQRDAVGLAVFDEQERSWLRPAATSSQLMKICDTLDKTKPDRKTELSAVMKKVAGQIKSRGLIMIISDLLTDLDSFYDGLGRLQHQGNEVLIFQILDPDEIDLPFKNSVLFRDIEGGKGAEELFAEPWAFRKAYKQAMETFIGEVRSRCHYAGINHLMLRTSDDLGVALSHYLHGREQGAIGHHVKMTDALPDHMSGEWVSCEMTKSQNPKPNQIPNPKSKAEIQTVPRIEQADFLGFGHWDLGFIWDLEPWDVVICPLTEARCSF